MSQNRFRIVGSKIYDPDGNEFIPFGTNANGKYCWVGHDTIGDMPCMVDEWGYNFIRLVTMISPRGFYKNDYKGPGGNEDTDAIVKAFTDRKIVVMIEMHDYTGIYPKIDEPAETHRPNQRELEETFAELARKYKDNPYVWFNVMNEPGNWIGDPIPPVWKTSHEGVIKAIRAEGADNIVVCDGHNYAFDYGHTDQNFVNEPDSAIMTYGPELAEYGNVMFSIHTYQWVNDYERWLDYVDKVHAKGLALMTGESGAAFTENRLAECYVGAANALKSLYDRNIGFLQWSWEDVPFFLTQDDTFRNGGWEVRYDKDGRPYNLGWLGRKMWNYTHGIEQDFKTAEAELSDLATDRVITKDTKKAAFGITVKNIGDLTIRKNQLLIELYIGHDKVYEKELPVRITMQNGYAFTTDEIELPEGEFTVRAVMSGLSKGEIEINYTRNTENMPLIDRIELVEENFVPNGMAAAKVYIKRNGMDKDAFRALNGSFFASGTFVSMCKINEDESDDDTLCLVDERRLILDGKEQNITFRIRNEHNEFTENRSICRLFKFDNFEDSDFGFITNFHFAFNRRGWESWGGDKIEDSKLILVEGKKGMGHFAHVIVDPETEYTLTAKAWGENGADFKVYLRYDLARERREIAINFSETEPTVKSLDFTIPEGSCNFHIFAEKKTEAGTAYIDYIDIIEK